MQGIADAVPCKRLPSFYIAVALDTQVLITIEAQMVFVAAALGRMAACTGHHLPGPGIENLRTDGMGKSTVKSVAFVADIVDRGLEHIRMIGAVRRMAIRAGAS